MRFPRPSTVGPVPPRRDATRRTAGRAPARLVLCLALTTSLGFLGLTACGDAEGPPVAELRVEPEEITLAHSSYRDVELDWTLTSELEGRTGPLRVFVHLLDDEGRLTRTFDHPVPGGWAEGEERSYPVRIYQSALAPPLPPGDYSLSVGLYDGEGNRWPIDVEGEQVADREYVVARVTVPSAPGAVPSVSFSDGWSPTYAGSDRQIVAVRWLSREGTILLDELEAEGRLWLQLRIPSEEAEGPRRIVREGEGQQEAPGVRVAAPCSAFEAFISGEESHDVEIPIASEDATCQVRVEPNYAMVEQGLEQQALLLENIAWKSD